jgi:hypothetical protein
MKASQSSLYREIENLMLWFIPIGNNIPKDFSLRELGKRMLDEITDSLTACNLALQARELRQRLELINLGFLKYNSSYALKRKLFGKLKYFWKCCYLEGRFNKVTLRKRYRLSEFLLKENNLLNL